MSEDLFVQAYENGRPQQLVTAEVLDCFAGFVSGRESSCVEVRFGPRDSSTIFLDPEAPSVDGLTVNRPCGDPGLARCLHRVMQLGNCVLLMAPFDSLVVTAGSTVEHLPADMVEAFPTVEVAADLDTFVGLVTGR